MELNEQKGPEILDEYPQGTILPSLMIGGDVDVESLSDDQTICMKHPLGYFKMGRERYEALNGAVDADLTYVAADGRMFYLKDGLYGEDGVREWMDTIGNIGDRNVTLAAIIALEEKGNYVLSDDVLSLLGDHPCSDVENPSALTGALAALSVKTKRKIYRYTVEKIGSSFSVIDNFSFDDIGMISDLPGMVDEDVLKIKGVTGKFLNDVRGLVGEVVLEPPVNAFDMASYCGRVERLVSLVDGSADFVKEVTRIRSDLRKFIVKLQRRIGVWSRLEWKTEKEAVSNVREVVSAYLDLPCDHYSLGDEELELWRAKILSLKIRDMTELGLRGAIDGKGSFFSSCSQVLVAAFDDDYGIAERVKPRRDWSTREKTLANVYEVLSKRLSIPDGSIEEFSDEWWEVRGRICSVVQANMFEWGLEAAFNNYNRFYNSHLDILIDLFDEDYSVKEVLDRRRAPVFLRNRSREFIINFSKKRILSYLGISGESQDLEKVLELVYSDFVEMELVDAFADNKYFDDYFDLLIGVFGDDEEFRDMIEEKKKGHYRVIWARLSKEEVIEKSKMRIIERKGLPLIPPSVGTKAYKVARKKVLSIYKDDLVKSWRLSAVFGKSRYFRTYSDLIIALFDEDYSIKDEFESRKYEYRLSWETKEETHDNVLRIVSERLRIPQNPPSRGGAEWYEIRSRIILLKKMELFEWGRVGAYDNNEFYDSHIDVLIAVFDKDYDVKDEMLKRHMKKRFSWTTVGDSISSIREGVFEFHNLPPVLPSKEDPTYFETFLKIISVDSVFLKENQMGRAFGLEWFDSYRELMVASFPEFGFKVWHFTPFGRSLYRIANNSEIEGSFVSDQDLMFIKGVLCGDGVLINQLQKSLYSLSFHCGGNSSVEVQKARAFENILQTIEVVGEDCPVSLEVLWRKSARYVKICEFYEGLFSGGKHREYHEDRSQASLVGFTDVALDDDDVLTLKQISENLSPEQQALYQRLMDGEIDFSDPEAVKLITSIQASLVG